jgi:hypothetical protein
MHLQGMAREPTEAELVLREFRKLPPVPAAADVKLGQQDVLCSSLLMLCSPGCLLIVSPLPCSTKKYPKDKV